MSESNKTEYALVLDTTGKRCPIPVLKIRRALESIETGQILKVIATDPSTKKDVPHFCESNGHNIQTTKHTETEFLYYIVKG